MCVRCEVQCLYAGVILQPAAAADTPGDRHARRMRNAQSWCQAVSGNLPTCTPPLCPLALMKSYVLIAAASPSLCTACVLLFSQWRRPVVSEREGKGLADPKS